jgi:hypothetical protein
MELMMGAAINSIQSGTSAYYQMGGATAVSAREEDFQQLKPTVAGTDSYTPGQPDSSRPSQSAPATEPGKELTAEEKQAVTELEQRDQEVRTHEMSHVGAGGQYVQGGASFEYQTGPDGRRYAVGGEVSIDAAPVSGDPQATINKMMTVQKAALAPANPSGQDRAVAAKAAQALAAAQQELMSSPQKSGSPKPVNGVESIDPAASNHPRPPGKTSGYTFYGQKTAPANGFDNAALVDISA